MKLQIEDVSTQTGYEVETAACRWQPDPHSGGDVNDCLSAVDSSAHLILFERSRGGAWQGTDLSHSLDRLFSRVQPVYARLGGGFFQQTDTFEAGLDREDALILADERGHLVICRRRSGSSWKIEDVTDECSVCIDPSCRPVVWEEARACRDTLYILAVGADGKLVQFFLQAGRDWRCHNSEHVSAPASLSLSSGDVIENNASTVARKGAFSISKEGWLYRHLCPSCELMQWQHELVSSADCPRLRPHSTAVVSVHGLCHVAVVDVFGSVLIYRPSLPEAGLGEWLRLDVTAQTGCRVRAIGTAEVLHAGAERAERAVDAEAGTGEADSADGSLPGIVLTAFGNGRAYRFWWNVQEQWQVTDLEEVTGLGTRVASSTILRGQRSESLTLVSKQRLYVCHGLETLRFMTRRLVSINPDSGHPVFSRHRRLFSRLVAWTDGSEPEPELRSVGEAVFGSRTLQRNAASYLDYTSGSAFVLERDDVVGWFSHKEAGTVPESSSRERIRQRFQQAIHCESSPGSSTATESTVKGVTGVTTPAGKPQALVIVALHGLEAAPSQTADQVTWSVNGPVSVISLVQQILSICAGLPQLPREDDQYDLMALDTRSQHDNRFVHPNGAWKLLLGWVRPRLVTRAGRYRLKAVADSREVMILASRERQALEYFVIENRQPRPMDDISAPGLLVWHVMHRPGQVAQRIRASDVGLVWKVKLATAITSNHSASDELLWADGGGSGYTLMNVSSSADIMTFDLELGAVANH